MKILLSAYACEPNHGSEPGVGWNWAIALAKLGHKVCVLTRKSNRNSIEKVIKNCELYGKLDFIYYDLPFWLSWWKKGRRGVHLYYFLWQLGVFTLAKQVHKREKFDLVHHVTFVSLRQPSFMGLLGIPFIFGPVGGGERAPFQLRASYGVVGYFKDLVRDIINHLVKLDPFMWITFHTSSQIYVTSSQSMALIPAIYHYKTDIELGVATDNISFESLSKQPFLDEKQFHLVYVGQFLYWKGGIIALRAFAKFLEKNPDSIFTFVGQGPDEKKWKKEACSLGVENKIKWVRWLNQAELHQIYSSNDMMLYPSLHDSGGMVVLEALSAGLPVLCLKLGGPGEIVNDNCGMAISVKNKKNHEIIQDISNHLYMFSTHKDKLTNLREGAIKRANDLTWEKKVCRIYKST